jgi:hypothetical protein
MVRALLSRNWLGSPWCFTEAVSATFRGEDVVGIEAEDLSGVELARAPPIQLWSRLSVTRNSRREQ